MLWRRLADIAPAGASAPVSPISTIPASSTGAVDAVKQAAAGLFGSVERITASGWAGLLDKGEPDGLAFGVGAVELADRFTCGGYSAVGHVRCAGGAASAVVVDGETGDGGDTGEEVLCVVSGDRVLWNLCGLLVNPPR